MGTKINKVTCYDPKVVEAEVAALRRAGRWEDAADLQAEAMTARRFEKERWSDQPRQRRHWWQK